MENERRSSTAERRSRCRGDIDTRIVQPRRYEANLATLTTAVGIQVKLMLEHEQLPDDEHQCQNES